MGQGMDRVAWRKIAVDRLHGHWAREVTALTVGGAEGVFAVWAEDGQVHLAQGEDGYWAELAWFNPAWVPGLVAALSDDALRAGLKLEGRT